MFSIGLTVLSFLKSCFKKNNYYYRCWTAPSSIGLAARREGEGSSWGEPVALLERGLCSILQDSEGSALTSAKGRLPPYTQQGQGGLQSGKPQGHQSDVQSPFSGSPVTLSEPCPSLKRPTWCEYSNASGALTIESLALIFYCVHPSTTGTGQDTCLEATTKTLIFTL